MCWSRWYDHLIVEKNETLFSISFGHDRMPYKENTDTDDVFVDEVHIIEDTDRSESNEIETLIVHYSIEVFDWLFQREMNFVYTIEEHLQL